MKAVVGRRIDVSLIAAAGLLEGGFVDGPAFSHARIQFPIVEEERGFDLRHFFGGRLASVERDGSDDDLGEADGEGIGHAATEAEADDADLSSAGGMLLEPLGSGDEVFGHLGGVAFRLHLAAFIVVAGVAAEGEEGIGSEGEEAGDGETAGHVFDIGIEPAVFVDDHDAGLLRGADGFGEVAAHFSGALGRGIFGGFGFDPFVVFGHLLGVGVVRGEGVEQRADGDAADGEA